MVNYQGRIAVEGVDFDGTGQFEFALVNGNGSIAYWSNDGSSIAGLQPTTAVTLAVAKGLYAVLLGDTALANMTSIPSGVFTNADVRLRVWFSDGTTGFQLLTPDQRLAPNGYLPAGSVSSAAIASGSITSEDFSSLAVDSAAIKNAAISTEKLAPLAINAAAIADAAITTTKNTTLNHVQRRKP